MKLVRVLLFIDWYRPGYKAGGPVQSCANLVEQLQGREISFRIVTRITDYCETSPYPGIAANQWITRSDGSEVYYLHEKDLSRHTLSHLISTTEFDVAYINGIYSRWFSIEPLRVCRKLKPAARIVIAARGMLAPSAMAIKPFKKKLFLQIARLTGLYKNVTFHSTGTHETAHIRAVLGHVPVKEAGNLPARSHTEAIHRRKTPGHIRLICVARIAPEKNIDYALRLLAGVKSNVQFDIYGPVYNEQYAAECRTLASQLPAHITVNFHGPVEPDMLPAKFAAAHALLLPTRGENFGHVILQAFQGGCPVIISDQTPWRNLEAQKAGFDLPLQSPQAFADAAERLAAMDEEEFSVWSNAAMELGKQYSEAKELVEENRKLFINP
ncbi:MAG: glycosyltransferase family 4 protein [Bacteroidia bacterium]|nr:glycosyltransferase family 4 protein [Bacteroidia bacterium]